MPKVTLDFTDDQWAGITHARELGNQPRAGDDQIETNEAYVAFIMGSASDSYAKTKAMTENPAAIIAAKDIEISSLKAQISTKDAAIAEMAEVAVKP